MSSEPTDREHAIRILHERGELAAAATLAIETYGAELYGFLVSAARSDEHAAEAFAQVCHDLWQAFAAFRWHASVRTWLYVVARHGLQRLEKRERREHARIGDAKIEELMARVRTTTALWQRTELKQGVARLRDQLDPDDRTLLILRVDRGFSWREVAEVLGGTEAAMRKRFERVKLRLRELAAEANLLPAASTSSA